MDPDPQTRRWAARDMLDHIHSSSVLVERLLQEKDVSVREVILTTLTCLGDTTAVRGLIDCLRSEDAALRNEAVSAMRLLPDVVAPVMQDLLHDADSDVRIFAVNILEALRHPRVEQWLCEVAEFDSEVNVCATAVDLLGEVGTPAALDALRKLKDRFAEEPYIQFAADLAISRIMHGMNGH
ncbi:repeat-containing PBS lyase heat domain protein [Candidatus Symbiobacter mobilis CR]|uniref:Repeat-containing PBS lyase heat domain protein n=2 Tax=Candidatus Symbiobacter TaxID=1436289 RepID=U5N537_9BURK|nr:repeat-containing PBS lyase heat domain protein [Candidatus Symbiobacter mobilis CR]